MQLGGQARRIVDKFLDSQDKTNEDNANYGEATTREASRDVRRSYDKRKAIFDLRPIHVAAVALAPVWLDAVDGSVEEPVNQFEPTAIQDKNLTFKRFTRLLTLIEIDEKY